MALLTFQRYHDRSLLDALGDVLQENGIPYVIENDDAALDAVIGGDGPRMHQFRLKVNGDDFPRAEKALETAYSNQLESIEPEYYLFDFSDQELLEIVSKPDEWGRLDYELAKKILTDRGITTGTRLYEALKSNRYEEVARPERIQRHWLVLGYIAAFLGGIFGIVIAAILIWSKKTVPSGKRVPVFAPEDRNHAMLMAFISVVFSTVFWFWL